MSALLSRLRPTVYSVKSPRVYDAMIREGLRRSSSYAVLVASQAGALRGVALLAWGGRRGRRVFALRHPLAVTSILWARVLRRMGRGTRARSEGSDRAKDLVEGLSVAAPSAPGWLDEAGRPGRLLFVGVEPEWRGNGIGSALVRASAEYLARNGCGRAIGHIDEANLGSLLTMQRVGWTLVRDGRNVVAYVDLRRDDG